MKFSMNFDCLLSNYKLLNEVCDGPSQRHSVLLANKVHKLSVRDMGQQQMLKTVIAPTERKLEGSS